MLQEVLSIIIVLMDNQCLRWLREMFRLVSIMISTVAESLSKIQVRESDVQLMTMRETSVRKRMQTVVR